MATTQNSIAGSDPCANPLGMHRVCADDMDDTMELYLYEQCIAKGCNELKPLYNALKVVQDAIYEAYAKFDRAAVDNRKRYEVVSVLAVGFGAASVFFALTGTIAEMHHQVHYWIAEGITAALTLLFILVGWFAGFKDKWMVARCKAERLRLLKFEKLVDPGLWCDPPDLGAASASLKREVHELAVGGSAEAREWAEGGTEPDLSETPCKDRCERSLHELVDYYVPKRLNMQMAYMEQRWPKDERWGRKTAVVVNVLFFGSFFFVLAHLGTRTFEGHEDMKEWLAVAALGLPIVAAAIRTFRASREFERNAMRHHATYDSLSTLAKDMEKAKDLAEKFRIIGFCETILEADCREFMRLVAEAEWYG